MTGLRFKTDQMGTLQEQRIREVAPAYVEQLKAAESPQGSDWTDQTLLDDTAEQITLAMEEFGLSHPADLMRFLSLRHSVGPRLGTLGRVKSHLTASRGTVPPGSRVLKMIADTPASYWAKIRGQAGYEGSETLESDE